MPGDLYSVDQIIDKTLIAAKDVSVYRMANNHATPFGIVKKGQPVGVVYSWLAPNPTYDRSILWWMYYDASNKAYYSKMEGGLYNLSALQEQGVLTVAEQLAKEAYDKLPWYEQLIDKYGPPLLWTGAGIMVVTAAVKGYFSRPKST